VTMVVESLDRLRVCEARVMDNIESGHPALGGPGITSSPILPRRQRGIQHASVPPR
jgi:hypothetical protein